MFTSYTVDNDKRFARAIDNAAKSVKDLRVPFTLILADFYKSEQAIFKLKGPGKYEPISERYGARKEKLVGFRYPLLVKTGAMAASLLGPNNPGSVAIIQPQSMTWGTSIPYTIYHQSDEPRTKIPLRKVLFIGPEAPRFASSEQIGRLQRWTKYISDYVAAKAKKALT